MSPTAKKNKPAGFSFFPLLWLSLSFALGILAAKYFETDQRISLIFSLIFGLLAAIFNKQKLTAIFLLAAFTAAGAFCFQAKHQNIPANRIKKIYEEGLIESGEPIEIEGVLVNQPESAAGGFFLEVRTERLFYKGTPQTVAGKVRLFAPVSDEQPAGEYEKLDLQTGSRIRAACHLRREESFLNPGVVSRKEVLDQMEIDALATIKSPLLVEKIGETGDFAPAAWLFRWRAGLIRDFREKFSVSTAGIMIASLLGNKYFLDRPTAELFREGGTFHVLVISGLHITFIGGLTLLLIRFFTRQRFWQFWLASLLLWSYSIAVGAEVPVIRATVMFTGLLFSQILYRHGTLLNSLGGCALILLIWRPEDLFSASFQLTFVSVAAIVAGAFPLIENLRAIGEWRPSAETPFPPDVSAGLKRFCEMLYWRENVWKIEGGRNIWTARLFKSPYLKWLEEKSLQGIFRYAFEALLVSLIVQIWLLPLLIVYFHRLSPASIFLNLWVGIFIALESFAALSALMISNLSDVLALPLIKLTEILNWLLLLVPRVFVDGGWASFRVPVYAGVMKAVYFLYFLPILFLTIMLNRWNPFDFSSKLKVQRSKSKYFSAAPFLRLTAWLLILLVALVSFHPFSAPRADGRLRVDFLDVGQGDAALITFPNGETMLVDGGGRPDFNKINAGRGDGEEEAELFEPDTASIGEAVVSEFLWEKGYDRIDYLLATHADADHLQGLIEVAKNFRVRAAFFGRTPEKNEGFAALSEVLRKRNIEIIRLKRHDILTFGGANAEILFPEADEAPDSVSDNNHSIVLRLVFGARIFLLTGDIEKETERELLEGTAALLRADLVKVAHHGSRTSSTAAFINATKARYAIISVGRDSPYGHPHREVLERWKSAGAEILTTGERGTISVSTGGEDLLLERFLPLKNKTP